MNELLFALAHFTFIMKHLTLKPKLYCLFYPRKLSIIFTPVDGKVSGLKGKDAEFVTNVLSDFKEFNLGGRDEYNKRERYVCEMIQDPSTNNWKWYDEKEEMEDEFLRSKG